MVGHRVEAASKCGSSWAGGPLRLPGAAWMSALAPKTASAHTSRLLLAPAAIVEIKKGALYNQRVEAKEKKKFCQSKKCSYFCTHFPAEETRKKQRSVSSVGLERLLDRQEVNSSNLLQITTHATEEKKPPLAVQKEKVC